MTIRYLRIALPGDPNLPLGGFYERTAAPQAYGPETGYLQLLWLREADGTSLVFILADLLFFPRYFHEALLRYFEQEHGIPPAAVIAGGTHTHAGINFGFFAGQAPLTAIQDQLFNQLCRTLIATSWKSATLRYFQQTFDQPLSVGRRVIVRHMGTPRCVRAPRPGYPANELIAGLQIAPTGDRPICVVTYASHPVFDRGSGRSGDYPGTVMHKFTPGTRLLIFQGFSGDLRPDFRTVRPYRRGGLKRLLRSAIPVLLTGARFANYRAVHFQRFTALLCERISTAMGSHVLATRLQAAKLHTFPLRSRTGKTRKLLRIHLISFSGRVLLVGFSAEVFHAYLPALHAAFPNWHFLPMGCLSPNAGYVVEAEDLVAGGYEVDEAPTWNSMDAPFDRSDIASLTPFLHAAVRNIINQQTDT